MGLNLKNQEVVELATQVALLAKESKTEAIRKALLERRERLLARAQTNDNSLRSYMEKQVWPLLPARVLGKTISREEEDQILGYGPEGF